MDDYGLLTRTGRGLLVATNGIIPSSLDWREYCRILVAEDRD